MARANNGGWDFVKVGGIYQYKEEWLIGMFEVIQDKSNVEFYEFELRPLLTNVDIGENTFNISHVRNPGVYWSGMQQLYKDPEYVPLPIGTSWKFDYRTEEEKENGVGEINYE